MTMKPAPLRLPFHDREDFLVCADYKPFAIMETSRKAPRQQPREAPAAVREVASRNLSTRSRVQESGQLPWWGWLAA
jgi:hypothetical protein